MLHTAARRDDIDGLRAVAVLLVILFHAEMPGFGAGFAGVDIFFVISGYLMARILVTSASPPDVMTFYIRRIRRVLPLLTVVFATTLPAAWVLLMPGPLKDHGQATSAAILQLGNLLFWWESGYFELGSAQKPLLHTWSLGVEAQFYLTFPLILGLLGRNMRLGLLLCAVLSFAAMLGLGAAAPDAVFYLLPFRLWELLAGALAAICLPRLRPHWALAGVLLIVLGLVLVTHDRPWPWLTTALPVAGTVLVLAAPWQALVPFAPLGRWSYGLYLWHWPVFVFWRLAAPEVPVAQALWWMLPALVLLSWATYRLIERPFQTGARLYPGGAGAITLLAVGGIALHLTGGVPGRLQPGAARVYAAFARETMPCHNALDATRAAQGMECRLGAAQAAPRIVLLGDSHAGHLAAALDAHLRDTGQAALAYTRSWCVPLPGFGTTAPGRGADCPAFMSAAFDRLRAAPPDLVILAAQWASYAQGGRPGVPQVHYAMAGSGAGMDAAVLALAAELKGIGARVVLVEATPEFPTSVPDDLMRQAQLTDKVVPLRMALDGDQRQAEVRAALAPLAAQRHVTLLPTRDLFCKADLCQVADPDGRPFFRDSNHLTDLGAQAVIARLAPHLDAP